MNPPRAQITRSSAARESRIAGIGGYPPHRTPPTAEPCPRSDTT